MKNRWIRIRSLKRTQHWITLIALALTGALGMLILTDSLTQIASSQSSIIFEDDFNRKDGDSVGNGWVESENGSATAEIAANQLQLNSADQSNNPIVSHLFPDQTSGKISWTFQHEISRTGDEGGYEVFMQLGNSNLMTNPLTGSDNAGVAVNLKWAGPSHGMTTQEGFGHVNGTTVTQMATISGSGGDNIGGPTDVVVELDLDAGTYDVSLSGPGFISGSASKMDIAFDNNVDIDTVRFYYDSLNDGEFGSRNFDNVKIEGAITAPAIDIEKATNGDDADTPPGPSIPVGDPVNWTYLVTNTGGVDLSNVTVSDDRGVTVSCPETSLSVGASMSCTASGTVVAGQYANIGTATGTPAASAPVNDSDPSHHFGDTPTSGAWLLTGNSDTAAGTNFLGTTDSQPLELHVNNQRVMRFEKSSSDIFEFANIIGGASNNSVAAGVEGATISGGARHIVTGHFGTVGGGNGNSAIDINDTVGGGVGNNAGGRNSTVSGGSGNSANSGGAVGGGDDNTANFKGFVGGGNENSATGSLSSVAGGGFNNASGGSSTVGGGNNNTASGLASTVAGGQDNTAAGAYSFAAGRNTNIDPTHDGTILFADSNDFAFDSAAANEFAVRATGGARFVSAIDDAGDVTAGVQLPAGGGAWSVISDRNAKANFSPVDGQDILELLSTIPIEAWNYKSQDPTIRHIGPIAQDFYAAFSVGEDERHISTVDADGVALAAIQELYEIGQEKDVQIAALEERLAALEKASGRNGAAAAGLLSFGTPTIWLLIGGLFLGAVVMGRRWLAGGRR